MEPDPRYSVWFRLMGKLSPHSKYLYVSTLEKEHPMKAYYGTKLITAEPQEKDGKPGYKVQYRDNYVSWSPKDVFEEAYQPMDALSFGHAICLLKDGKKVRRYIWKNEVPSIDGKDIGPWSPSKNDILANDWQLVE